MRSIRSTRNVRHPLVLLALLGVAACDNGSSADADSADPTRQRRDAGHRDTGTATDAAADGGGMDVGGVDGGADATPVSDSGVADSGVVPSGVCMGRDSTGGVPSDKFPGPACTGVPAGTTLTPYSGPCTITTANTVIDSKQVNCEGLVIRALNVTIRNSKVLGHVWLDQDFMPAPDAWSMTLTDTEVDAGATANPAVCCGNYSLLRVNAHGGHNGAQCENGATNCRIEDSWLHGQYEPVGGLEHLGGFLCDGGTPGQLIHNYIVCDHRAENDEGGCTGDINLIANFGPMSHWLIQRNFLGANADSAYCTYGGHVGAYSVSDHIVYRDNLFERANTTNGHTTNRCAAYGPVTNFDASGVGNEWTNNTWADNGTPVSPAD